MGFFWGKHAYNVNSTTMHTMCIFFFFGKQHTMWIENHTTLYISSQAKASTLFFACMTLAKQLAVRVTTVLQSATKSCISFLVGPTSATWRRRSGASPYSPSPTLRNSVSTRSSDPIRSIIIFVTFLPQNPPTMTFPFCRHPFLFLVLSCPNVFQPVRPFLVIILLFFITISFILLLFGLVRF